MAGALEPVADAPCDPPEPRWVQCSACCDWTTPDGPQTATGEPLCRACDDNARDEAKED